MPARFLIEDLPETERKKVLNALLEGQSLRKVAALVGCSHEAVKTYKTRVLLPAMKKAEQFQSIQRVIEADSVSPMSPDAQKALTKDIVQTSPLRARLEKLWGTAERCLDKAENAVREIKDEQGNVVAIAQDLSAVAPILNQAHKNVELLGRVTGELRDKPDGPSIAVQIVVPALTTAAPRSDFIDVTPEATEIGLPKR